MRDQARAVLGVLHVLFVLVLALPRAMVTPADLSKKEVQEWFEARTDQAHAIGLPISKEQLIDQAVWWGSGYEAVRSAIARPAGLYAQVTGARQSWRMFGDVPQSSAFLFIEGSFDGEWRPIYEARSDTADWRRPFFDQERPRTFINQFTRKKGRKGWDRFTRWLARELPKDFPEAEGFRVGMQEVRFPATEDLPEQRAHKLGKRFWLTELGGEVSP
jgi:hypothetical protein